MICGMASAGMSSGTGSTSPRGLGMPSTSAARDVFVPGPPLDVRLPLLVGAVAVVSVVDGAAAAEAVVGVLFL